MPYAYKMHQQRSHGLVAAWKYKNIKSKGEENFRKHHV